MKVCFASALALALTGAAAAQAAPPQKISDADKKFLAYAAKVNQQEIQMSRLAEQKAQSPAVKAFARLMVSDHAGVEKGLSGMHGHAGAKARPHRAHVSKHVRKRHHAPHAHVAQKQPPAPPARPENPPPNAAESKPGDEALSKLRDKSGADFDRAFMAEQVDYHQSNLDKINDEIKNTKDDNVRRFAEKIAGAFKQHLDLAKAVKDSGGAH